MKMTYRIPLRYDEYEGVYEPRYSRQRHWFEDHANTWIMDFCGPGLKSFFEFTDKRPVLVVSCDPKYRGKANVYEVRFTGLLFGPDLFIGAERISLSFEPGAILEAWGWNPEAPLYVWLEVSK